MAAFLILYFSIDSILSHRIDVDLLEDVAEFQYLAESNDISFIENEIKRELKIENADELFIRLLDKHGQQFINSDLSSWPHLQIPPDNILTNRHSDPVLNSAHFSGQEFPTRMVYAWINENIILHMGESVEPKAEIMEILLLTIIILFCLLIPIISIIGWFMAKRAVSGIKEVSKAAGDIQQGKFSRRVTVKPKGDEVLQLADTFNSMAECIHKLITEMREMTDNIAHDLRSPIARIRVISEQVLSEADDSKDCNKAAADTLEECDRLTQLINTTLDVAEAEAGVSTNLSEKVDLYSLTKDACELFEAVAEQKSIDLTSKLESVPELKGDQHNLQRMLANLLDNALKYTPEKGQVSVQLMADQNEQQINIAITDTGIGMPPAEQHRIFERFFRSDQSRSEAGCGLGLSYARAVANAHGGKISVFSIPSETSTFTITFPFPQYCN